MGLFHDKYCTGYWNTLKMALELEQFSTFWMERDNSNMITKILFKKSGVLRGFAGRSINSCNAGKSAISSKKVM